MHVLVLENASGASRRAAEQLEVAGHEVSRCHDPEQDPFPCKGLTDACPLDRGDVDVVVTVRDPALRRPRPLEDGVVCGLRQRLPLVVAGEQGHPYEEFATRTVSTPSDLVDACEEVVERPREPHSSLATVAARDVLENHGIDGDVVARVLQRGGRLLVDVALRSSERSSHSDVPVSMVSSRIVSMLGRFDRYAQSIDVAIRHV